MATNNVTGGRPVNVLVAYVFGAIYLLVGLVGFLITGFEKFAGRTGKELILFEINPLHNIVHLGVGAALLYAATKGLALSRTMNTLVGAVYLLVGLLGLFIVDSAAGDILSLNSADNLLHLASAAVLLGVGLAADKARTRV